MKLPVAPLTKMPFVAPLALMAWNENAVVLGLAIETAAPVVLVTSLKVTVLAELTLLYSNAIPDEEVMLFVAPVMLTVPPTVALNPLPELPPVKIERLLLKLIVPPLLLARMMPFEAG